MFGLAFRYLVDEKGLGLTYKDIKNLYRDILTSNKFEVSFEKYTGLSVQMYEEQFYYRIPSILE